ncbi:hypothetical protein QAD02_014510 [Eretmocerus hayati]|uniref:Uncharacterized protein n=1 Tax=Eretmocerus hayati TaxID=131215 RepID=A0ACC2P6J1_9HYME|nr:hypothetical protein QAD02_014510 [Eretmocerus hayati]
MCEYRDIVEHKPRLAEDLYALLVDQDPHQEFYDVVFLVKKKGAQDEKDAIYAHTTILAARSPALRAMFTVDTLPRPYFVILLHQELGLENVEKEDVMEFLKFLYTDNVDLNMENVINVMKLAIRFQIESLQAICEHTILSQLSLKNCASFLHIADAHNLEAVKSAILMYIRANIKLLLHTPEFKALTRVVRASQQLLDDLLLYILCD